MVDETLKDRRTATYTNWEKGANNIASSDRLPAGFARDILNADPTPGGRLELRIGYERVYDGAAVRGVLALGSKLLIADGASLVEFNTATNSSRVIRTIDSSGHFVGAVLNNELFFCTETECLRYDGTTVRGWGVPDVNAQPPVVVSSGGSIPAGYYQLAMTYTDGDGQEGGTDKPLVVMVNDGGLITVTVPTPPAGCTANLYVGAINSGTPYFQTSTTAGGSVAIGAVRDDTARCGTILMRAPVPGSHITEHNSTLAVANGAVVQMTQPMRKHLVSRATGFFQYPVDVGMLLSVNGVLIISADRTYALDNAETSGVNQRVLLEYPAVAGTAVLLPSGEGAWMTKYGQAITDGRIVRLPNETSFAPIKAGSGAAGVVDHNGNQLVVTTLQGAQRPNSLAASDFFIGEVK